MSKGSILGRVVRAHAVIVAGLVSCSDPLHSARVDALGDERSGVSPGPTHRPNQPCLTCHGGSGPADAELSVAGTIFQTAAADSPPLGGATVTVYDATETVDGGAPRTTTTNAAGNFFFRKEEWSPTFPLHDISVQIAGIETPRLMHTVVGRDGSCASCHFDPAASDSHGHVYMVLEASDLPEAQP